VFAERGGLEMDLDRQLARRTALFEQAPVGMVVIDPSTRKILEFNAAAHHQLGYTRKEFEGLELRNIEAKEGRAEIETHFARALSDGYDDFVTQHRTKIGEIRDVRVIAKRVDLAQGIVFESIWEDITERKRLEVERTEALARLERCQEEERHRLSRELHDQTAQRLVGLAVELKNLETALAGGRPYKDQLHLLRRAVDDLQRQVHDIAWGLRTGEPAQGNLEDVLPEYLEEWSDRAQVTVDWDCRGLEGRPLPSPVQATLYRVTQEALANVQRHSHARRVGVLLERDESIVRLTVEDDGHGFDAAAVQQSPAAAQRLGLLGMQERVSLAGGTLLVESSPESGTTIVVRIPIPTECQQV
jgi:PAS domain S-box-containing protein